MVSRRHGSALPLLLHSSACRPGLPAAARVLHCVRCDLRVDVCRALRLPAGAAALPGLQPGLTLLAARTVDAAGPRSRQLGECVRDLCAEPTGSPGLGYEVRPLRAVISTWSLHDAPYGRAAWQTLARWRTLSHLPRVPACACPCACLLQPAATCRAPARRRRRAG